MLRLARAVTASPRIARLAMTRRALQRLAHPIGMRAAALRLQMHHTPRDDGRVPHWMSTLSDAEEDSARASLSSHNGWGMLAKTIEKSLMQKYSSLEGFPRFDGGDAWYLRHMVQESIAVAQEPTAETAFLNMAAESGNAAAAARLMPQKATTSGSFKSFGGNVGGFGGTREDEYTKRAEMELLKKLRQRLAAEKAAAATAEQTTTTAAPDGSAMPQKAGQSGAMPGKPLGGRGKALEECVYLLFHPSLLLVGIYMGSPLHLSACTLACLISHIFQHVST